MLFRILAKSIYPNVYNIVDNKIIGMKQTFNNDLYEGKQGKLVL